MIRYSERTPENDEKYIAGIKKEWEKIACLRANVFEKLTVNQIGSAVYAFGSELAVLRLANVLRGRCGYSENRGTFYYCEELN